MEHTSHGRRIVTRSAAAMFAAAGVMGIFEASIGGGPSFSLLPALTAMALGALTLVVGPRLPEIVLMVLGPVGVVLVGLALGTTDGAGDGAILYVWPVVWLAAFFGRPGAALAVASVAVVHAVVVVSLERGANVDRWLDVVATIAVLAGVMSVLASRNRRLISGLLADARLDLLTGLLNRRGLAERLEAIETRPPEAPSRMAVVVFDIDHFKRINDDFGHDMGDRVLTWVGSVIDRQSGVLDIAARSGGEEFVVVLPDTGTTGAIALADRVRAALRDDRAGAVTVAPDAVVRVSAGVATGWSHDVSALLRAADRALYTAKRGGRDRTIVARAEPADVALPLAA